MVINILVHSCKQYHDLISEKDASSRPQNCTGSYFIYLSMLYSTSAEVAHDLNAYINILANQHIYIVTV